MKNFILVHEATNNLLANKSTVINAEHIVGFDKSGIVLNNPEFIKVTESVHKIYTMLPNKYKFIKVYEREYEYETYINVDYI